MFLQFLRRKQSSLSLTASVTRRFKTKSALHDPSLPTSLNSPPKARSNASIKKSTINMKGIKIDSLNSDRMTLSDTLVERYFVVGIEDCPKVQAIVDVCNKFQHTQPPLPESINIHYSSYQPIPFDTRRIEILQSLGLPQHAHKTSPIIFACQTRIIPDKFCTNGVDRATFPTVFIGDHVFFITHLTQRAQKPLYFPTAKSHIDSLKTPDLYQTPSGREQSTTWTKLLENKHSELLSQIPQRNNIHQFY
jgi:hypothetical protein